MRARWRIGGCQRCSLTTGTRSACCTRCAHGTESRLTLFELEDLQQELRAPACGFAACLDASLGLVGAHETESEAADDGHVFGAVPGAEARQIVPEFDNEQPIPAFHTPMAALAAGH